MIRLKAGEDGADRARAQKQAVIEAVKAWVELIPQGHFIGTRELNRLISPNHAYPLKVLNASDIEQLQAEGYGKKGTEKFKNYYGVWCLPNLWGQTEPKETAPAAVDLYEDELPDLPGDDAAEKIAEAVASSEAPTARDWNNIAKGYNKDRSGRKGWGARKNLMYGRPDRG